jgi:hypothetical protein
VVQRIGRGNGAQKNGIYPLTATFTPAGGDAATYLGSSDAESFKLQKK